MVRTVSLFIAVKCGRDGKLSTLRIPIFEITEGDHVWNTLVEDYTQSGPYISYTPCIEYLRICAEAFAQEHPDTLVFNSPRKAWKFSADNMGRPVCLRGHGYTFVKVFQSPSLF